MVLTPHSFTDKLDKFVCCKVHQISQISGFLTIQSFLLTGQITCKITPCVAAKVQTLLQ